MAEQTPLSPDKKNQLFSASAQVNPPTPHLPPQPKPKTPTDSPTTETTNENNSKYVLPWTKVSNPTVTTQTSISDNAFLPNSSMPGSTISAPGGGQILTIGKPQNWGILITVIIIFIIISTPISLLAYGSYKNWNLPFTVPLPLQVLTDQTIFKLPLVPKYPPQLIRVIFATLAQQNTINHQLIMTSNQVSTETDVNFTISGKTVRDKNNQTELIATGKLLINNQNEVPLTINLVTFDDYIYLKVDQNQNLPMINFTNYPQQWIRVPIKNSNRTAGKQALNTIREKKLSELLTNAVAHIISKTQFIEDDNLSSTHYILNVTIDKEQIKDFIEQGIAIYLETQSEQIIDEFALSTWKDEVTKFIAEPITIKLLISKADYLPENMTIGTSLHPHHVPQINSLLADFERPNLLYQTKLNYTPTFSAKNAASSQPSQYTDSSQIDWENTLTDPIFDPFVKYILYNTGIESFDK